MTLLLEKILFPTRELHPPPHDDPLVIGVPPPTDPHEDGTVIAPRAKAEK